MKIEERINQLEERIRQTPYHKGTEHQIGRWRAQVAKLRNQMWRSHTKKTGGSKGYAIRKAGDATVVLVGPPSVGKSSLINRLTSVKSKVGAYDFTTLSVVPGMMKYQGALIQLFDIPGIIKGAALGKGRGREVLSVIRSADLILILVDIHHINKVSQVKKELIDFGIRLDERPPRVTIKKTARGGVKVTTTSPLSWLSVSVVKDIVKQFGLSNAGVVIKENITMARLIDALMANRLYLPHLVVINKSDLINNQKNDQKIDSSSLFISVKDNQGIDKLQKLIWKKLNLVHVYLKPKGEKADLKNPLIIKRGWSLKIILEKMPIPNKREINKAKIYGSGAKFEGQEVNLEFQPQEGTIINFGVAERI